MFEGCMAAWTSGISGVLALYTSRFSIPERVNIALITVLSNLECSLSYSAEARTSHTYNEWTRRRDFANCCLPHCRAHNECVFVLRVRSSLARWACIPFVVIAEVFVLAGSTHFVVNYAYVTLNSTLLMSKPELIIRTSQVRLFTSASANVDQATCAMQLNILYTLIVFTPIHWCLLPPLKIIAVFFVFIFYYNMALYYIYIDMQ